MPRGSNRPGTITRDHCQRIGHFKYFAHPVKTEKSKQVPRVQRHDVSPQIILPVVK